MWRRDSAKSDLPESGFNPALKDNGACAVARDAHGWHGNLGPDFAAAAAAASMSSTRMYGRTTGFSPSCIGARTPNIPPFASRAVSVPSATTTAEAAALPMATRQ